MKRYLQWIGEIGIILGIIVLLGYVMRDLMIPGLPMFHDSNPHIARAIAYHAALLDGQFPPMWAKEVLGGIGSPVLMLNYQLPYMLNELWHRLGATIFDSYKLTLGITYILSGVLMYLALRKRYSRSTAGIGALLYTLAPYRMVDIFVRGALGEAMSFMFPPLLIWGYTQGIKPILIIGWAGLFLTHPVASAAFSAFFLGYCLVTKKDFDWISYLIAAGIAAFNILPTLVYTKLTYYSPSLSDTLLMFPTLGQLFHSSWGYGVSMPGLADGMSFEIGLVQLLILATGIIYSLIKREKEASYLTGMVVLVIIFILPITSFVYKLFLGQFIDFPWRLLLCVVFGTAWLGSEMLEKFREEKSRGILAAIIVLLLLVQTIPIAHTNRYWESHHDEVFFSRETGDSYGEYAPRTRVTRDSAPFGKRAEIIRGEGEVVSLVEKSNQQKYLLRVSSDEAEMRINTTYFVGWKIPENCSVTKERTLNQIDDSGLILCRLKQGEQTIEIKYETPLAQRVGNLITLAGIGGFIWSLLASFYPLSTKKRQ